MIDTSREREEEEVVVLFVQTRCLFEWWLSCDEIGLKFSAECGCLVALYWANDNDVYPFFKVCSLNPNQKSKNCD